MDHFRDILHLITSLFGQKDRLVEISHFWFVTRFLSSQKISNPEFFLKFLSSQRIGLNFLVNGVHKLNPAYCLYPNSGSYA